MVPAVVFKTPGSIPIEAFTHFGVNSKPNSENPIGYFGTGLKYAIAVLVRNGINPIVWIGNDRYEFFPKEKDFRGKEFTFIRMKRINTLSLKKSYHDLPFTTQLGKNWELWMAFRELEANTRDEHGTTEMLDSVSPLSAHKGQTVIVVSGQEFVEIFKDINKIFLDPALEVAWEDDTLQVFNRGSEFIYYRGLRVARLEKPSKFTYNLLQWQMLTEDRTLLYMYQVEETIGRFVALSEAEELIRKVVQKDDEHWEGSIRWNYVYHTPGPTFMKVMEVTSRRVAGWEPSYAARGYYAGYTAKVSNPLHAFSRPFAVEAFRGENTQEERHNAVVDAKGKVIFDSLNSEYRSMDCEDDTWTDSGTLALFQHITKSLNEEY